MATSELGTGKKMTFTEGCDNIRRNIKVDADIVKRLKASRVFRGEEAYHGSNPL